MNYLYGKNLLFQQGLPVFTLELVYEGREPEVPDAFHVSTKSYLFAKENLCRILETKIPKRYTKLAFLDADVYFSDKQWYTKVSKLLNSYDVVQPFERAHWLDLTYKKTMLTRKTVLLNTKPEWDFAYHPGFAWCFRRTWFTNVGFFDYAVSGSGDTLSSAAWLSKTFPKNFQSLPPPLVPVYTEFRAKASPRITYLKDVDLYHLYHGARQQRQYAERHKLLQIQGDIRSHITKTSDGVFEWVSLQRWNPLFLLYFRTRDDDGLSEIVLEKPVSTS